LVISDVFKSASESDALHLVLAPILSVVKNAGDKLTIYDFFESLKKDKGVISALKSKLSDPDILKSPYIAIALPAILSSLQAENHGHLAASDIVAKVPWRNEPQVCRNLKLPISYSLLSTVMCQLSSNYPFLFLPYALTMETGVVPLTPLCEFTLGMEESLCHPIPDVQSKNIAADVKLEELLADLDYTFLCASKSSSKTQPDSEIDKKVKEQQKRFRETMQKKNSNIKLYSEKRMPERLKGDALKIVQELFGKHLVRKKEFFSNRIFIFFYTEWVPRICKIVSHFDRSSRLPLW